MVSANYVTGTFTIRTSVHADGPVFKGEHFPRPRFRRSPAKCWTSIS